MNKWFVNIFIFPCFLDVLLFVNDKNNINDNKQVNDSV